MTYLFTSEAVTEGHPDKICDLISDSILDDLLAQDKHAHVAVEAMASTGLVVVAGEVQTTGYCDVRKVVKNTIRQIGYTHPEYEFSHQSAGVLVGIHGQSPDIAQGVREDDLDKLGAGDQGIMFGYASDETRERMPLPILLANRLAHKLSEVRKSGKLPYLRPDGKVQITVEYSDDHRPLGVPIVVIAQQHDEKTPSGKTVSAALLARELTRLAVQPVLGKYFTPRTRVIMNGTGKFVIGGPASDTGLTGRKIIADTYGGMCPHGGGCFSGKDPTKVDRSAAYMARYIAKNVVAAKLAKRCTVQLGYVIGKPEPVSVWVDTHGTGTLSNPELLALIRAHFRLRPGHIIADLDLRRPIYKKTAVYGHFGREDPDFTWERTDKAAALAKAAKS